MDSVLVCSRSRWELILNLGSRVRPRKVRVGDEGIGWLFRCSMGGREGLSAPLRRMLFVLGRDIGCRRDSDQECIMERAWLAWDSICRRD